MPAASSAGVGRPPMPRTAGHSLTVSVKWNFIFGLPPPTVFWSTS
jgi:hypothetical protein